MLLHMLLRVPGVPLGERLNLGIAIVQERHRCGEPLRLCVRRIDLNTIA